MNSQERAYFAELSKDRAESADMLEKPSLRGIKKSVVDKYSDQAHFIYELLQNADDAKATRARFVLEKDRLIFAHNGMFFVYKCSCNAQSGGDGIKLVGVGNKYV